MIKLSVLCHEDFLLCHFFLCLPSPHSVLLFLHLTLTPSLIHILSGSQASFQSQDTAYSLLCKSHVYYQMTLYLCLSLSPSFHVSITPLAVRAALVWVLMAAQLVSLSERELALFDLAKWSTRRPK